MRYVCQLCGHSFSSKEAIDCPSCGTYRITTVGE